MNELFEVSTIGMGVGENRIFFRFAIMPIIP